MIMSLVLFEKEFLNIVSISFTALVINELIMVALEITTWLVFHLLLILKCMHRLFLCQAYLYDHFRGPYTAYLCYQYCIPARIFR